MTANCILVVDDNNSGRYIKTRLLRKAGHVVAEAATAKEGLEYISKYPVDLAVIDVKLPDLHGFELCKRIKELNPPILVLQTSATFVTTEDRIVGLNTGADAYLVEPTDESEFVATVEALLRLRRAEAARWEIEQRFMEFAQASPDVMWIFDVEKGEFEFVSDAFRELSGYDSKDVLTDPARWLSLVSDEDKPLFEEIFSRGRAGERVTVRYRLNHADGSLRWVLGIGFPLKGAKGNITRVAGLARDITERMQAQERADLLLNELSHRVKNTLAIVQSLASLSRVKSSSLEEFGEAFSARLYALSNAHDLLTRTNWESVPLRALIDAALEPFADHDNRIVVNGPDVWIAAEAAVMLGIVFHELGTNATKYGALSNNSGQVTIEWAFEPPGQPSEVALHWRERGGPLVKPRARQGFGSMLIERVLAAETVAPAILDFAPEGFHGCFRLALSPHVSLSKPRSRKA